MTRRVRVKGIERASKRLRPVQVLTRQRLDRVARRLSSPYQRLMARIRARIGR